MRARTRVALIATADALSRNAAPLTHVALAACFLMSMWSDSVWPLAAWLVTVLAGDFDKGWSERRVPPVTPGMVRISRHGKPPVEVPATQEAIDAAAHLLSLADGPWDGPEAA